MRFSRAITRPPGPSYVQGLTQNHSEGPPDLERALEQHRRYEAALESCGVEVLSLPPQAHYPDATFVEDTALVTPSWAISTRPGAPSRLGEVESVREALARFFPEIRRIEAPGTVDAGDVCEAGSHYFIGLSARTNAQGAAQLAAHLTALGCTSTVVDIRGSRTLLHLKTGLTYLGDERLVVAAELPLVEDFRRFELVRVEPEEAYAANCVRMNDHVLVADGYPRFAATIASLGYRPITLDMSEYRKMDGGLSCLSLRF